MTNQALTAFNYNEGEGRDLPAGRHLQKVSVGKARADLADPDPDQPDYDITGRWLEVEHQRYWLLVNQAGLHIEAMLSPVLNSDMPDPGPVVLSGDVADDYYLYGYDKVGVPQPDQGLGEIRVRGDGKLELTLRGETIVLRLVERRPTLFPKALARAPKLLRLRELHPLAPYQRDALERGIDLLIPLLEEFFALSGRTIPVRRERSRIAKEANSLVGDLFSSKGKQGIHQRDLPLMQQHGRSYILNRHITIGEETQSLFVWFHQMLHRAKFSEEGWDGQAPVHHFEKHLNVGAAQAHVYEANFQVLGLAGDVGIGLGGFYGEIEIRKTVPNSWTARYPIHFGGVSFGPSVGVNFGIDSSGTGVAFEDWTEQDFVGVFVMSDGSAGGGVGPLTSAGASQTVGLTELYVPGRNSHSSGVSFDFSGQTATLHVGGGGEAGISLGYIHAPSKVLRPRGASHTVGKTLDYVAEAGDTNTHFALGDAFLTPEARIALRRFCAIELAVLMDPTSRLVIEAHADRVADKDFNLALTAMRAANVQQAIEDIVGKKRLKCDLRPTGYGESHARDAGDEDDSKNPEWRRVDLKLNSRHVVQLRGVK